MMETIRIIRIRLLQNRSPTLVLLLLALFATMLLSGCSYSQSRLVPIDNLDTLYEATDKMVYFGRKTCASCGVATKYLLEVVSECEQDIYYFDTDQFREDDLFQTILADFKIDTVPMLVKISNGEYVEGLSLVTEEGNLDKTSIQAVLGLDLPTE